MARLFMGGNEFYDYRADGWVEFSGTPTTAMNQPGGRRTLQGNGGKYYYYPNASTGLNKISKIFTATPLNEAYGRFAYQGGANRTARNMMQFRNSQQNVDMAFIYSVDAGSVNNQFIQLRNSAGTSFGQSGLVFDNSIWNRVEWHLKTAASGGIFEVWVNDTLFISLTGLNTSNGAVTTFDQIVIGQVDNVGLVNPYDDIAVNDLTGTLNNGRVGEGYIVALFPTRAGTFSQLTNTYGSSVENYDHINRPVTAYIDPINNSLYVGTNTPGFKDTYKGPTIPQEFGAVSAVKVVSNCVRNGAAITNAKLLLEPGVVAQFTAPTFTTSAGGSATAGTHLFTVVNKTGSGYALPGPASAQFTAGANATANLTIPTQVTETGTAPITAREIYATKANTDTTIAAGSNGAVLPQATINVVNASGFPTSGTLYITNSLGIIQQITYTNISGNQFTGCSGGVGTILTGGLVTGPYYLVGTLSDNTTTAFVFNIADTSFGTLNQPVEIASANIALPQGAFGYIDNLFDHNPTTGLAFSREEVENMECGIQFMP